MDNYRDLSYSTVAIAPSPATTGASLTVRPGDGAKFPEPPFVAFLAPPEPAKPSLDNTEKVRVTGKEGDTFTGIERHQGVTGAQPIAVGWQVYVDVCAGTIEQLAALAETPKVKGAVTLTGEATLEWGKAYRANAAAGSFNLNMPPATGNSGDVLYVKITVGSGTNTVMLVPHAGEQFNSEEATIVLSVEQTYYRSVMVVAVNNNPEVF